MVIGDTSDTVLAPSVSSGTSMIVREVTPGITISRIILADSSLFKVEKEKKNTFTLKRVLIGKGNKTRTYPLSIANIRTPSLPMFLLVFILKKTITLCAMILRT